MKERLNIELDEDTRQRVVYSGQIISLKAELDNASLKVIEFQQILKSKRDAFEAAERAFKEIESLDKFIADRVAKKKDQIADKEALILSLKKSLGNEWRYLFSPISLSSSTNISDPVEKPKISISLLRESKTNQVPLSPVSAVLPIIIEPSDTTKTITIVERSASSSHPNDSVCLHYNISSTCKTTNCPSNHSCIACGLQHPMTSCTKDRTVCVKFNMEECKGNHCVHFH